MHEIWIILLKNYKFQQYFDQSYTLSCRLKGSGFPYFLTYFLSWCILESKKKICKDWFQFRHDKLRVNVKFCVLNLLIISIKSLEMITSRIDNSFMAINWPKGNQPISKLWTFALAIKKTTGSIDQVVSQKRYEWNPIKRVRTRGVNFRVLTSHPPLVRI